MSLRWSGVCARSWVRRATKSRTAYSCTLLSQAPATLAWPECQSLRNRSLRLGRLQCVASFFGARPFDGSKTTFDGCLKYYLTNFIYFVLKLKYRHYFQDVSMDENLFGTLQVSVNVSPKNWSNKRASHPFKWLHWSNLKEGKLHWKPVEFLSLVLNVDF